MIDIVGKVTQATLYQKLSLIIGLLFITFLAGYSSHPVCQPQNFDQFSYKAQEVDAVMKEFMLNPSRDNQISVHNDLVITYGNWADREYGANKEAFKSYLNACDDVVHAYEYNSPELQNKIKIMNEKKDILSK